MDLIESHSAVPPEVEDAADIVFPSGKSRLAKAGLSTSPPKKRTREVAKGDYGIKKSCPSNKRSLPGSNLTPLQSGLSKLVEASVRFDPGKDGIMKQGFFGQGLTPPELRDTLRRLFMIRLTEPELSAVFAHFVPDGGMEMDGNMFIMHFIKVM